MHNITLIPREKQIEGYINHVHQEGALFHVLHWDTSGTHCSERDCVINKSNENKQESKLNDITKRM